MRVSGASIEINDEAPEEDHPGVAERQSVSGVNSVFVEISTDTNKPSRHVKFHGNAHPGRALLGRKTIEPLKADDASVLILDKDHVVVGFLAETFLLGIVEPDTQGVSLAVVVDRQLFDSSFPDLSPLAQLSVIVFSLQDRLNSAEALTFSCPFSRTIGDPLPQGDAEMRLFQAMFALWPCVAMTENVCRGADPEGSFITFLSHRSGRNLLYRMRSDGSNLTPIFGGELQDVPGLAEGLSLYRP